MDRTFFTWLTVKLPSQWCIHYYKMVARENYDISTFRLSSGYSSFELPSNKMVDSGNFEIPLQESKSWVLPLHYESTNTLNGSDRTSVVWFPKPVHDLSATFRYNWEQSPNRTEWRGYEPTLVASNLSAINGIPATTLTLNLGVENPCDIQFYHEDIKSRR